MTAWNRILEDAITFPEAIPPLPTEKHGRPKRRRGHNCVLRLKKRKAECLRFLYDPRQVPFNNEAKRDRKMVKLRQMLFGTGPAPLSRTVGLGG